MYILVISYLLLFTTAHSSSCDGVTELLKSQVDLLREMHTCKDPTCDSDDCQSPSDNFTQKLDDIENALEKIKRKLDTYSPIPQSCEDIKSTWPSSSSGYYSIVGDDGLVHQVYCNMDTLCGSDSGWTRVAYLNMSDTAQHCPDALRLYEQDGVRACGRPATGSGSCPSVQFTATHSYTQVCGRVIGYQYGYTGGINPIGHASTPGIDETFVDGVSITRGSPRQHIWTFFTTYNEVEDIYSDRRHSCPCVYDDSVPPIPSFIGDDWFCESGSSGTTEERTFYTGDKLWDGYQCGPLEEPCCGTKGEPWFHKTLNSTSSDYLELRVCDNGGNIGEGWGGVDSPVALYELYIM